MQILTRQWKWSQCVKLASAYVTGIDVLPGRKRESFPEITDEIFWTIYGVASPFSLLHVTGFYNIYQSIHYIYRNNIPGDFVECGCFLGGAAIFIALLRDHFGMTDRMIWLLDTFQGFPDGEQDRRVGGTHQSAQYVSTTSAPTSRTTSSAASATARTCTSSKARLRTRCQRSMYA